MSKAPIQIYIVDDEPSICTAYARLVRSASMQPRTFPSVEEFMQAEFSDANACVISDVQFPGKSGLELPVLLVFAWLAFDVRVNGSIATLTLLSVAGGVTFASLGLLVAARAESPHTVSGLINALSFPMYLFSGVFFASSRFPDVMQPFIRALPLTALNDALRAVMIEGAGLADVAREIAVVAGWGGGAFALALRLFRWR